MFVCILFCGFNGTNGTESLVWQQQQLALGVISKSTQHHFLFNTNKQNEYSATQLERFHLLPVYVCTAKCYKNTLFDDVGVTFIGGYPICPLTRQAQMHVSDSYLIFSTYEWGLKPIWEYRNPCDFSCLHGRGPYPICATWEDKIRFGSLEPCSVNAALDTKLGEHDAKTLKMLKCKYLPIYWPWWKNRVRWLNKKRKIFSV